MVLAVLGLGLVWRLSHVFTGGDGGDGNGLATGASPTASASRSPAGTEGPVERAAVVDFPKPADGTRLELKIFGLGDNPESCRPASLLVGGDVRTVYHFDCTASGIPESNPYFFHVKLTNLTGTSVPVELGNFAVSGSEAGPLGPLDTTNATFEPVIRSTVLGAHASTSGWITFDGTSAFVPSSISYADGGQTLTVRFRGTWV